MPATQLEDVVLPMLTPAGFRVWPGHDVPQGHDIYYYEVQHIRSMRNHDALLVHIGFLPCDAQILGPLSRSEGLELVNARISNSRVPSMRGRAEMDSPVKTSFVEDRDCFAKKYPLFHMLKGEVIGCGVDFSNHVIFFTKNGMLIEAASLSLVGIASPGRLMPAAKIHTALTPKLISANFGRSPFCWNPLGPNEHVSRLWIPGVLFDSYKIFFLAATEWDIDGSSDKNANDSHDGRELKSRRFAQSTTITTRAIPTRALNKGISYFEVEILKLHSVDGLIAIGYEQDSEPVTASLPKRDFQHAVGAVPNSWGYNSKGIVNCCGNTALDSHYAPMFRAGDTIGCGVIIPDPGHGNIFYTRNGGFLGSFFKATIATGPIFPSVTLSHGFDAVRANFGQVPFRYPLERVVSDSVRTSQWPRLPREPSFPPEVVYAILAAVAPTDDERKTYAATCSLVCRYWARILSPYLFKTTKLQRKGDADILSILIEQPKCLIPTFLTSLTIQERACDAWAYSVAMLLAHRLPNLQNLILERDPLSPLQWKEVQRSMPPSISRSLPALYSAYKGVTTLTLVNHHFPSFATFTQLVSVLPVLKSLQCNCVTWGERPNNPRLLRAPGRLSTIQMQKCEGYWQMIQLFTARWGRLPLDWEPSSKCPELNYNDSLLIHALLNFKHTLSPPVSEYTLKALFTSSTERRTWCLNIVLMHGSQEKVIAWDLVFSPCVFHWQDGLIRTCLTDLRINTINSLDNFEKWILPLDEQFSKAPLPFLANVTITFSGTSRNIATVKRSDVLSKLSHLQRALNLQIPPWVDENIGKGR